MKRIVLLLVMLLIFSYGASAQSNGRLFYNIGSHNGIGYELPVGKHLLVESSANVALSFDMGVHNGGFFFDFGGIYPTVHVAPRWYFNSESTSPYYRTGVFAGLQASSALPMLGLGVPKFRVATADQIEEAKMNAIFTLRPHVGWTFNLGKRFFISPSVGLEASWANVKLYNPNRSLWVVPESDSMKELSFALDFGFRF